MNVRRIVAGLDWRSRQPAMLLPLARLAGETRAELIGLFVEDVELLQIAALPFAREVGFPSAIRRELDVRRMERALQAIANDLKRACEATLGNMPVTWSFRVARGSRVEQLVTVAIEQPEPTLLVPTGADVSTEPATVSLAEFSLETAYGLLLAKPRRPLLILP